MDLVAIGYKAGTMVLSDVITFMHMDNEVTEYKQDTDQDGNCDGVEVFYIGSDPYVSDSDEFDLYNGIDWNRLNSGIASNGNRSEVF